MKHTIRMMIMATLAFDVVFDVVLSRFDLHVLSTYIICRKRTVYVLPYGSTDQSHMYVVVSYCMDAAHGVTLFDHVIVECPLPIAASLDVFIVSCIHYNCFSMFQCTAAACLCVMLCLDLAVVV